MTAAYKAAAGAAVECLSESVAVPGAAILLAVALLRCAAADALLFVPQLLLHAHQVSDCDIVHDSLVRQYTASDRRGVVLHQPGLQGSSLIRQAISCYHWIPEQNLQWTLDNMC